jgi:hypothetical protein
MTLITPLPRIGKPNQQNLPSWCSPQWATVLCLWKASTRGIVHVGMPNKPNSSRSTGASNRPRRILPKVTEFPSGAQTWDAGPMIIFELDDRRFAIDWNVTELNQKPADVIPIRKKRQGKSRSRRLRG